MIYVKTDEKHRYNINDFPDTITVSCNNDMDFEFTCETIINSYVTVDVIHTPKDELDNIKTWPVYAFFNIDIMKICAIHYYMFTNWIILIDPLYIKYNYKHTIIGKRGKVENKRIHKSNLRIISPPIAA